MIYGSRSIAFENRFACFQLALNSGRHLKHVGTPDVRHEWRANRLCVDLFGSPRQGCSSGPPKLMREIPSMRRTFTGTAPSIRIRGYIYSA